MRFYILVWSCSILIITYITIVFNFWTSLNPKMSLCRKYIHLLISVNCLYDIKLDIFSIRNGGMTSRERSVAWHSKFKIMIVMLEWSSEFKSMLYDCYSINKRITSFAHTPFCNWIRMTNLNKLTIEYEIMPLSIYSIVSEHR